MDASKCRFYNTNNDPKMDNIASMGDIFAQEIQVDICITLSIKVRSMKPTSCDIESIDVDTLRISKAEGRI